MITRPRTSQAVQNVMADVGLVDHDDSAGTGDLTHSDNELVAS